MFNKYTLTFQLANLEQEYRENQIPVVKKEYTTFSYQACLYMIFQSIYYQRSQPYFLAILLSCCFVVIFILFSKFLIYKYPGVINIILPILVDYNFEIVIQIIALIQVMTGIMVFVLAIFISLFIQGYLLLSQAFIVIGLYTFYGLIIPLKSILVYCSLLHPRIIKAVISTQQGKEMVCGNQIKNFQKIDTVLEQSIIVIKLDKQQDQLRVHQMNNITKEILQVNNDNDLRTVLRNLTYSRRSKLSGEDFKYSLEKHIRMMLQSNQSSGSTLELRKKASQDKFVNSLICYSNLLKNQFKVQIVNF